MKTSAKVKQSAQTAEIRALILANEAAKVAPKRAPRAIVEVVDKSLHALALKMATAEGNHDKALNAVYNTFKLYALAALPIIERLTAHTAALHDIRTVFGESRKSASIQRVTMLNNMRKIAFGAPATRDTVAQSAQGVDCVQEALEACTSLPALKKALGLMKEVVHAATGVAKLTPKGAKVAKVGDVSAVDVAVPNSRAEAIKAACSLLQLISDKYLLPGTDADLLHEVDAVMTHLQAKAA